VSAANPNTTTHPCDDRNSGHKDVDMRYRRLRQPGGTFFFTVNLANRTSRLLVDRVDVLRASVRAARQRHPFDILGWVVLPDHLHALWTLPDDDCDNATRWALIKSGFSRALPADEPIGASRRRKGERGIWQRRFWEHVILDDDDLQRHLDYIHINPVKHGYVAKASDWPHSSIHREVREGRMPLDWAAPAAGEPGAWGER
jgi:putative transposase